MIQPLVFSRDRPAQLDLLLRSLEVNGDGVFGRPTVLAKWSDVPFYRGYYNECDFDHSFDLVPEWDFEQQVRGFLTKASDVCVFLCDDNVLYRALGSFVDERELPVDPVAMLHADEDLLCFSLRLGANTVTCYPLDREHEELLANEWDGTLVWDWRSASGDYAYPASLDGHFFRTADVVAALEGRSFTNPSQMEDALVAGFRNSRRYSMASYPLSALLGNPLNRVSATHTGNRVAEIPGCSPAEMNERYLAGERLSLAMVDPERVDAAHCEFAPVWELPLGRRGPRKWKKSWRESGVTS